MAEDGVQGSQDSLEDKERGTISHHTGAALALQQEARPLTVRSSMPFFSTKLLAPSMFSPSSGQE